MSTLGNAGSILLLNRLRVKEGTIEVVDLVKTGIDVITETEMIDTDLVILECLSLHLWPSIDVVGHLQVILTGEGTTGSLLTVKGATNLTQIHLMTEKPLGDRSIESLQKKVRRLNLLLNWHLKVR